MLLFIVPRIAFLCTVRGQFSRYSPCIKGQIKGSRYYCSYTKIYGVISYRLYLLGRQRNEDFQTISCRLLVITKQVQYLTLHLDRFKESLYNLAEGF